MRGINMVLLLLLAAWASFPAVEAQGKNLGGPCRLFRVHSWLLYAGGCKQQAEWEVEKGDE